MEQELHFSYVKDSVVTFSLLYQDFQKNHEEVSLGS